MSTQAFDARVRREGDVAVIDLSGVIDGQAEGQVNAAFAEATETATSTVVLNFADVTYINSTGIAVVVGLLAQARRSQHVVRAFGLSDHYREIFEITRLVDFMQLFNDEPSAIAAGA